MAFIEANLKLDMTKDLLFDVFGSEAEVRQFDGGFTIRNDDSDQVYEYVVIRIDENDNVTGVDYGFASFGDFEFDYNISDVDVKLNAQDLIEAITSDDLADDRAIIAEIFSDDDRVTGSSKGDTLNGYEGNDVLVGYGGADAFLFTEQAKKSNADVIEGFKPGADQILLDASVFDAVKFGKGGVNKKQFELGEKADDGNDYIIYDKSSGKLFYDPDGEGGDKQQLIATLQGKPDLGRDDIGML